MKEIFLILIVLICGIGFIAGCLFLLWFIGYTILWIDMIICKLRGKKGGKK